MERGQHLGGLAVTVLLHVGLVAVVFYVGSGESKADKGPKLSEMTVIEASLAYKNEQAPKQPQKPRKETPKKELEGVSRDETKVPEEKKEKEKPPKNAEPDIDWEKEANKFKNNTNDDAEEGKEVKQGGSPDGHELGFADVNKGHPYLRKMVGEFYSLLKIPSLERSIGKAAACVVMTPDGKIARTEVHSDEGTHPDVVRGIRLALKDWQAARDENPEPFEDDLLKARLTKEWTCFRVDAKNN